MDKRMVIVLYIRISVEDEDSRTGIKNESNSISNQRDMLRGFVEHAPEFEGCEIRELCDDGFSGTSMERPGMQDLLQKARAKELDCVIVKDFSRFGRDYIAVSDYVDQIFPFLGIRFISVNDGYDSAKMKGRTSGVDIAFRNVIYSYYSKDLSMKVKSGKRTKALKGDFLSSFAPIGYRKDVNNRNRLVVDEDGAGIVRRIFELAGTGMSVGEITFLLNAEKVPTPSAVKNSQGYYHKWWIGVEGASLWNEQTVMTILRDERYLGKTVYGKRYRPHVGNRRTLKNRKSDWIVAEKQHEPLVTESEFKTAQEHLAEFTERAIEPSEPSGVSLFTGKLRCGHCGYALIRRSRSIPRYVCRTKYRAPGFGCMEGSVRENEIAEVVLAAIQAYIKMLIDEKPLPATNGNSDRLAKLQKQAAACQGACAGMDEQKAQLYDAMAEGKISRETYQQERDKLSREQAGMTHRLEEAEAQLAKLRDKMAAARQDEPKLISYLQTDALTRQMVVDFVDCIYVYNDKTIHIKWTFSEKGRNLESV